MSPAPQRFRWILLLSLALNLGLASYLLIRPSANEARGRGHSMVLPPPHVIARVLSTEGREILEQVVNRHRAKIRPALQSFADGRRSIQTQLRQPVVDREALTAAFAELRLREQQTALTVQQMLIELSVALPAQDRMRLAELMDRPERRGLHRQRSERHQRDSPATETAESAASTDQQP